MQTLQPRRDVGVVLAFYLSAMPMGSHQSEHRIPFATWLGSYRDCGRSGRAERGGLVYLWFFPAIHSRAIPVFSGVAVGATNSEARE